MLSDLKTIFLSHKKGDSESQEIKNIVSKYLNEVDKHFWDSDLDLIPGQKFKDFANNINDKNVNIVILCCSSAYKEAYDNKIGGVGYEANLINNVVDSKSIVIPIFKISDNTTIPNGFNEIFGIGLPRGCASNEHEMIIKGNFEKLFSNLDTQLGKINSKAEGNDNNNIFEEKRKEIMRLLDKNSKKIEMEQLNNSQESLENVTNFLESNAAKISELTKRINTAKNLKNKIIANRKMDDILSEYIKEIEISDEIKSDLFSIANLVKFMHISHYNDKNNIEIVNFFNAVIASSESIDKLVDSAIKFLEILGNSNYELKKCEDAKLSVAIYADVFNTLSEQMQLYAKKFLQNKTL